LAALAAGSAVASDMPPSRRMPPPRAPAYVPFFSWNGFYLGINGGYAWGQSNWTNTVTAVTTGDFNVSGGTIGGTVGYNIQTGALVFGLEGDFDWSNIKGTSTTNCATGCETANGWLGTFRGRIGYAFNRFLPYVTGGLSFGDIKATAVGFGSASATNVGWTVGGGIEHAFAGNWSVKLEYLYVDLGTATCDAACSGTVPIDVTFKSHLLRGGLNYKF
jgi:outer membrane immunogenic protein